VEAFAADPKLKVTDLFILSLVTGSVDKPYHYSEAKNWGKLQWAIPVLDILMSGVSETVDYQLKTMFASANSSNQYLRIQVDLETCPDVDSRMDNASEENMRALKAVGTGLAASQSGPLKAFIQLLLR